MQPTLLITEYFHHSVSNSAPLAGSHYFILHHQPLTYFLPSRTCLFWTFQINGLIQNVVFLSLVSSLGVFSGLASYSRHQSIPLLYVAEQIAFGLSTGLLVSLVLFLLSAIKNKAAMNIL